MVRGLAILAVLLALSGCGFAPLYAPHDPQDWDADMAAIRVNDMADRPGQILTQELREDLNPSGVAVPYRWSLNTQLVITRQDLGIQQNATASASVINITTNYTVTDVKTGATLLTSLSHGIGDFDLLNDAYATQVAADSARDRALREVANEMALRMALFVRAQRAKAAAAPAATATAK